MAGISESVQGLKRGRKVDIPVAQHIIHLLIHMIYRQMIEGKWAMTHNLSS